MKLNITLFVSIFLMSFTSTSLADVNNEAFDEKSCTGELMSGKKALKLLGNSSSTNLAKTSDDNNALLKGFARRRQKLAGAIGDWHSHSSKISDIKPFLQNNEGELGLWISYRISKYDFNSLNCLLDSNQNSFSCKLKEEDGPTLGSGEFKAVMTDECLWLKSSSSTQSFDTEWVYLVRY